MALYAIGDTHLSLSSNKPMDVFGGGWEGYVDKLQKGFAAVGPEDTVVLCGDLSWGMSLEEAKEDFAFLDALPGARKFYEEAGDQKVFKRELIRLEASLKAAGERPKLCFLHYPPLYQGYRCPEIIALLEQYGVERCYYGHLHGGSHRLAVEGRQGGVAYYLVSADYVGFRPQKICE